MEEYLQNKSLLILILATLFGISMVDVILRATTFSESSNYMANYGEPLVTVVLSILLIFFALKGKDRVFYILCGGWLAYFVLCQLFGLPWMLSELVTSFEVLDETKAYPLSVALHLLSMLGIIAIGGLLVEYLSDGTIYNSAFKIVSVFTVLMITSTVATCAYSVIAFDATIVVLAVLNNLSRLAMVFLFGYFAYDSAKTQLSKTQL